MGMETYAIIVIGAGAAGLAAAARLARARRSALVVDARLRIGGRIWSHHEPGLPLPLELGAEFIHGRAKATFELLGKAVSAAVDTADPRWTVRDGRLVERSGDLFRQVREAMARAPLEPGEDMSFDALLRRIGDALSDEAHAFARTLVQGFDAADPARVSARAIVDEWSGGASVEAPQFRPLGGYGALLSALASEIAGTRVQMQLDTVVRSVRWKRGSVEVRGTFVGKPFVAAAKRAIVTLPLGVLQQPVRSEGAVRFDPPLASKREALRLLAAGPVLKALLHFRRAFWEKADRGRYADAAFFHAPGKVFPTFWTALPVRTPVLVAWAAGPNAQRLAGAASEKIVREATASLASIFGKRSLVESSLESAWVHDWQADPYARGAYSYVRVGGERARAQLAEPLAGTLFFAGEAADTEGESGTVAGALQSGARAARETIASLR